MPTVTEDNIFQTFKSLYEAQEHSEPVTIAHIVDPITGIVSNETEIQAFAVDADMEALVRAIIKAILDEIRNRGISMGPSTAKKMEVG